MITIQKYLLIFISTKEFTHLSMKMKKQITSLLFCLFICPFSFGQTEQFRCITWEKFKSSGPDLKPIGWMAVRHSKNIKSSPWSVGCETLDRDQAKFDVYKDYVGELGVKSARLQSGWAKCERQKGVYNFAWLDSCVYGLKEQGVNPWICLCYGNPIYGSDKNLGAGLAALVYSDEAMNAWLKYVGITVNRYKDIVRQWNIWNEPYFMEKDYAPLLIRTAEVIKKLQPESTVLGELLWEPEPESRKVAKELLEILKTENKLDLVDYWAYHPYKYNPDDCYQSIDEFRKFVQAYNPKYKLFQGENGCPSMNEVYHALNYYPWTEYSQAKWVMRRMAGDRTHDIPSSIFTIIDLRYSNMMQSFGLIRSNLLHEFIYKRPSYYGVQHMVSFFDDTVKPVGELEYESNSIRKMTVAGFKKGGAPVVLVWYKDQIPGDDFKWDLVDLTIKGVNFNDPVYVEMISGKVYEIDRISWDNTGINVMFKNLPVWDSLMMIVERNQIELSKLSR